MQTLALIAPLASLSAPRPDLTAMLDRAVNALLAPLSGGFPKSRLVSAELWQSECEVQLIFSEFDSISLRQGLIEGELVYLQADNLFSKIPKGALSLVRGRVPVKFVVVPGAMQMEHNLPDAISQTANRIMVEQMHRSELFSKLEPDAVYLPVDPRKGIGAGLKTEGKVVARTEHQLIMSSFLPRCYQIHEVLSEVAVELQLGDGAQIHYSEYGPAQVVRGLNDADVAAAFVRNRAQMAGISETAILEREVKRMC